MARQALLVCGIVSPLFYFAIDAFGALSYPGYDYASQTISEMSAVDAPTRLLLAPFYLVYTVLLLAFAFGVRAAADGKRGVRTVMFPPGTYAVRVFQGAAVADTG